MTAPRVFQLRAALRILTTVIFAAFTIAAVALVVVEATGVRSAPPLWFAALWLAALGWNTYWFLFRVCDRFEITDVDLRWHAPLRTGEVALADLTELRPMRLTPQVLVICSRDGRKMLVLRQKGLGSFATALQSAAPQMTVRDGFYGLLAERIPGPRVWR